MMEERSFIVDKGLQLVHQGLVLGPVLCNKVMNKSGNTMSATKICTYYEIIESNHGWEGLWRALWGDVNMLGSGQRDGHYNVPKCLNGFLM